MKFQTAAVLAILLGSLASAWAEGAATPAAGSSSNAGKGFGLGMEFGSVTINGTNYNTIHLQPDLDLGSFGVGLDLNFEFDGYGNFRTTEWSSPQAIATKIKYVRYGKKDEFLYIKAGSINDFVLGNGMIVNGYNNMLNYPALKKLGIAYDMDFQVAGFETMVGNVLALDIMGARLFVRPFQPLKLFLLDKLEIGGTVAVDRNPKNPVPAAASPYDFSDTTNSVATVAWGADLTLPVMDIGVFSLKTYFDFAGILGKGTGQVLGAVGKILSFIPYKLEIKSLQPRFTTGYFDVYYDQNRNSKYESLEGYTNLVFGGLFSSGVSMMNDQLSVLATIDMPDMTFVQKPVLTMTAKVDKELLWKKVEFQFSWIRRNLTKFEDIFSYESTSTILQTDLTYFVSENLALMISYRRTFQLDANGVIQPFSSTVMNTKITF